VCDVFHHQKVSEWQYNAGVNGVPDSVWFNQVQITDIPELVPVHLWPDCSIANENVTFLAEVKREEIDCNMLMYDAVTDYLSMVHSYSVSNVPCRNTMSQALDSMKHETEKMAEVHTDLSSQLFSSAQRMMEFVIRQKAEIKQV